MKKIKKNLIVNKLKGKKNRHVGQVECRVHSSLHDSLWSQSKPVTRKKKQKKGW